MWSMNPITKLFSNYFTMPLTFFEVLKIQRGNRSSNAQWQYYEIRRMMSSTISLFNRPMKYIVRMPINLNRIEIS